MKYLKKLLSRIGKAYKEITFLRWVTLAAVFIVAEVLILVPLFSHREEPSEGNSVYSSESITQNSSFSSSGSSSVLSGTESSLKMEASDKANDESSVEGSEEESSESSVESFEEESGESSVESSEEESSESVVESFEEESSVSDAESFEEESSESDAESSEEESSESVVESFEDERSESVVESSEEDSGNDVEESPEEDGDEYFEASDEKRADEEENENQGGGFEIAYSLEYKLDKTEEYYICTGLSEESKRLNIRKIVIPDTYNGKEVREISNTAFQGIYTLYSVTIGRNVEEVGEYVFSACCNLVEACILSNLSKEDCGLLKNYVRYIYTDPTETSKLRNVNGWTVYSNEKESLLLGYEGSEKVVTTPNGVTEIRPYVLYGTAVEQVILSDSVTTICSKAFASCETLTHVSLGKGVKRIESCAFDGTKLQSLTFPKEILEGWRVNSTQVSGLQDPAKAAELYQSYKIYSWNRD